MLIKELKSAPPHSLPVTQQETVRPMLGKYQSTYQYSTLGRIFSKCIGVDIIPFSKMITKCLGTLRHYIPKGTHICRTIVHSP